MEVRVKDVRAPISLRVMSRKLMDWYSWAQALTISSFLAWVSAGERLGTGLTSSWVW